MTRQTTKNAGPSAHSLPRKDVRTKPGTVEVCIETVVIPTYLPAVPDKNPMFLEKRVYQGSRGRVYPLPFTDRVAEKPVERNWKAIWIENEFIRAMVLPELGGRIHILQDKTNGYDLIYNQPVIKPALVGLAGPWISGGIEFNWPQHHRPATFLPVDFHVEKHPDGSQTIWCSDHEPMTRMKGMHGVCLHPGRAYLELKVRAYNRTPFVQTFLWWANVATRVHEAYQSFFPPDVYYVADHARRSTSHYPLAQGRYYGVDYAERGRQGIPKDERPNQFLPPHCIESGAKPQISRVTEHFPDYRPNDLSFYANIPTPCSYMCMGSKEDFFGGYDYAAEAGIVHVANHHISPGKKQWTWGNHEFGYAWDRNLTVADGRGEYGPYIEIMAGVYTDNQPDFSFLQPGETKVWSQFWYPIRGIGVPEHANLEGAVSLKRQRRTCHLGVGVTSQQARARIILTSKNQRLVQLTRDLSPATPLVEQVNVPEGADVDLCVEVRDQSGHELIRCELKPRAAREVPPPASEPPAPAEIRSNDELYLTGLHLEQYRHATRCPTLYWREALRRDAGDARCNNAMGQWHLRRGEFQIAEKHFRAAMNRLTHRNANPYDGEALYNLGVCLRYLAREDEAYERFYKSTWNQAWAGAGYHALAEIDCVRQQWSTALGHLDRSLSFNTGNTRARDLKAIALRKLGRIKEAAELLKSTLELDPLDWWARHESGQPLNCDLATGLDLAIDYSRAGLFQEAIGLLTGMTGPRSKSANRLERAKADLSHSLPTQSWGTEPLLEYYLGHLNGKLGEAKTAVAHYQRAVAIPADYCFPARLEDIAILDAAKLANPKDSKAHYYLGNLFYDRRRHEEAIELWEKAARLDPSFSVVWRNLGIGYFNMRGKPKQARASYEKAFKANPNDARLLYERDQLWKKLGVVPAKRLRELEKHLNLVQQRDDLSVELSTLYNQVGRPAAALAILTARNFQPWEGGEGGALGQYVRSHLAMGRRELSKGDATISRKHFESALAPPTNLGEARHLLANQSDIQFWLGCAFEREGNQAAARKHWLAAAQFKGDFQEMSVRSFSEMTFFSAVAWMQLGRKASGRKLLQKLLKFAADLLKQPATIDYFATSLPTMLIFEDDLQFRQTTHACFLQAQAHLGLGNQTKAKALLQKVLKRDPNHSMAADFLRDFSKPPA